MIMMMMIQQQQETHTHTNALVGHYTLFHPLGCVNRCNQFVSKFQHCRRQFAPYLLTIYLQFCWTKCSNKLMNLEKCLFFSSDKHLIRNMSIEWNELNNTVLNMFCSTFNCTIMFYNNVLSTKALKNHFKNKFIVLICWQ